MTETAQRVSSWAGYAAPIVTLCAILLATLLSPSFSWTHDPLSALGETGGAVSTPTTFLLFNGGLILGGLVAFGFGYVLYRAARTLGELVGIALFGATAIAMALIGVFHLPLSPHVLVASAFYVLLSASLVTYGAGKVGAGDDRRGWVTIALGLANLLTWVLWAWLGGLDVVRPGMAIPETVGAVILAAWSVWTANALRRRLGIVEGSQS
ncbi:MAG: DUF998 domain-containing protein [Haloarculaceae archaeon]